MWNIESSASILELTMGRESIPGIEKEPGMDSSWSCPINVDFLIRNRLRKRVLPPAPRIKTELILTRNRFCGIDARGPLKFKNSDSDLLTDRGGLNGFNKDEIEM